MEIFSCRTQSAVDLGIAFYCLPFSTCRHSVPSQIYWVLEHCKALLSFAQLCSALLSFAQLCSESLIFNCFSGSVGLKVFSVMFQLRIYITISTITSVRPSVRPVFVRPVFVTKNFFRLNRLEMTP